jgi:hypothetical protein
MFFISFLQFGFKGGGEIEIFAPPPKNNISNECKEVSEVSANENELLGSGDVQATNQMAQSLEMVHEFGAGEMPEEDNEGFATAQAGKNKLM